MTRITPGRSSSVDLSERRQRSLPVIYEMASSWNARLASPLLPQLFSDYHADPTDFLDVFREGVTEKQQDLVNFGSGDGKEFQTLSKESPAFAAEFAAIGLRNIRTHWGPINTHAAELRPEADLLFLHVQQAVDVFDLCTALQ